MKKFLLSGMVALMGLLPAGAQTEFRHITFDEAKTAAKAENKNIFIDFYTSWCGPCKRLAANVFPTRQVGDYLNSNYICLKIDAENGEGPELAKKYGVRAYPTLAVISSDGELLGSFAGLKEGDEFITAVKMCNNPELSPDRVKERYASGERNAELVIAYANLTKDNCRNAREGFSLASGILDDYYNSLTDAEKLDNKNTGIFTSFAWDYSSPRVKFLIDNRDKYAAEFQPKLNEVIKNALSNEASRYFSSNVFLGNEDNVKAYNEFKQLADRLGYASDFTRMFEFTDRRAECDDEAYLAFCDQNFGRLSENEQSMFAFSVTGIFATDTPEQKKAVSSMLRNHLPAMSANTLYMAASAIITLEGQGH